MNITINNAEQTINFIFNDNKLDMIIKYDKYKDKINKVNKSKFPKEIKDKVTELFNISKEL